MLDGAKPGLGTDRVTPDATQSDALTLIVLAKDEGPVVDSLLYALRPELKAGDGLIVVDDHSARETRSILRRHAVDDPRVRVRTRALDGDFSAQRNYAMDLAFTEWVLFIDADERPHPRLITLARAHLPRFVEKDANIIAFPRINTIENADQELLSRMNMHANEDGWIDWPDYQTRLIRRQTGIRWRGRVHEKALGSRIALAPAKEDWALFHPKTASGQIAGFTRYVDIVKAERSRRSSASAGAQGDSETGPSTVPAATEQG